MLVLTRGREEEIRIGDEIVVRVLDVKGDRVRLGISAPVHIPVHRQEVYLEIERMNRESLQIAGSGLEKARQLMQESPEKAKGTQPAANPTPASRKKRRKAVNTEVAHGT